MCGRLDLSESSTLAQLFERLDLPLFPACTNVAPTEHIPVILNAGNGFVIRQMRWSLIPSWAPEPSTKFHTFNARAESIESSKAFGRPFKQRRCLIPVAGYYEWLTEGKLKTPYRVYSGSPMLLAGIWDVWRREDVTIHSCSILTVDAVPELSWLHHRQPLFVPEIRMSEWCNPSTSMKNIGEFLLPHLPYDLLAAPVDKAVGQARYKGEVRATASPIAINCGLQ